MIQVLPTKRQAGNGENYDNELQSVEDSCYANDVNFSALKRQLPLLVDVVKALKPTIRKVTSVRQIDIKYPSIEQQLLFF